MAVEKGHNIQEQIVKSLRGLADQIEERGIRAASFEAAYETIMVEGDERTITYRRGPNSIHGLELEWADSEPFGQPGDIHSEMPELVHQSGGGNKYRVDVEIASDDRLREVIRDEVLRVLRDAIG